MATLSTPRILAFLLVLASSLPAAAQDAPAPPPPPTAPAEPPALPDFDPDDPMSMLQRMPPDVRSKLSGDEIVKIVHATRPRGADENIIVPAAFFGTIVGIVLLFVLARMRRDQKLHETLRAMIDKGVEIPPALLVPPAPKRNDRRTGIILATAGLGVAAFLLVVDKAQSGAWALGAVPFFLGVGYLVAAFLDKKSAVVDASGAG